jgi:hypothetical protein
MIRDTIDRILDASTSRVRRVVVGAVVLIPVAVLLAHAYRRAPGAATITVEPGQQYQLIEGWEATAEAGLDEIAAPEYLDELVNAGVALGLTRLRLEVRASYEHTRDIEREFREGRISQDDWRCGRYSTVNDNADPDVLDPAGFQFSRLDRVVQRIVLPFKKALEQAGDRMWLNVTYVAFTSQLCRGYGYVHGDPREYAEFVLAVYRHLRDVYALTPDSWEVALEPDNTRDWTAERMAQAMAQAIVRLQAEGFTPAFVVPSTTAADRALPFLREIWKQRAVRPYVRELSYHRYAGASAEAIAAIGRAASEYGIRTAMLEKIGAGYAELHEDLTAGGNSAWQQYVLGYPERDTGAHYLIVDPSAPRGRQVHLSASAHYLQQYFRAIRPGARRIGASTDHADFQPVAVRNRQGTLAVVVNAARPGSVTIRSLDPGTYRVSCWTEVSRPDNPASRCEGTIDVDGSGTLIVGLPSAGVLAVQAPPSRGSS